MKKSIFSCSNIFSLCIFIIFIILFSIQCTATQYGLALSGYYSSGKKMKKELMTAPAEKDFDKKLGAYEVVAEMIYNEDTKAQLTGYVLVKKKGLKVNIETIYLNLKKIDAMTVNEAMDKYQAKIDKEHPSRSKQTEMLVFSDDKVLFYFVGLNSTKKEGRYKKEVNEFDLKVGEEFIKKKLYSKRR